MCPLPNLVFIGNGYPGTFVCNQILKTRVKALNVGQDVKREASGNLCKKQAPLHFSIFLSSPMILESSGDILKCLTLFFSLHYAPS